MLCQINSYEIWILEYLLFMEYNEYKYPTIFVLEMVKQVIVVLFSF